MGNDRDNGDNISTRLTYFLVGAGIGAVLALLFAPKSGEELRNDIADATRKGIDRSKDAATQQRARPGQSRPPWKRANKLTSKRSARPNFPVALKLRQPIRLRRQCKTRCAWCFELCTWSR